MAFTIDARRVGAMRLKWHGNCRMGGVRTVPREYRMSALYLADAQQVVEAAELIATFGDEAPVEAAIRAGRMRDIGNHLHFCRWRQTERLIALMASDEAVGTVH